MGENDLTNWITVCIFCSGG